MNRVTVLLSRTVERPDLDRADGIPRYQLGHDLVRLNVEVVFVREARVVQPHAAI